MINRQADKKPRNIIVIGAGFSGLSAAAHLAAAGHSVTIVEKHSQSGGRARCFEQDGFRFDMGPSWYWMPDVFEKFFEKFAHRVSDFYRLQRLSPSYRVFFEKGEVLDMPSDINELFAVFEGLEPGSSSHLRTFLEEAEYKYKAGMQDLVYKPGRSLFEYADKRVVGGLFKLHMLKSFHSYVASKFRDSRLRRLLEFPVLFLGAHPRNIPALYSMMNYADMILGTWYPMGGMHEIVRAMEQVCREQGVRFLHNTTVEGFEIEDGRVQQIKSSGGLLDADVVVASADYHHIDQQLLPAAYRSYTAEYWSSRTLAPSSFVYYVGLKRTLPNLLHHNLFFDRDFERHAEEIYETPQLPSSPLFYLCVPSKTDPSVAPQGCENLFFLIPTAPGVMDTEADRELYFQQLLKRVEERCGVSIAEHVVYRRDYACSNFIEDYNSFKGNAYGLANTLRQTAVLKPSIQSKKLKNLYFTGQLTVPGPGVPPSLVSGHVVAREIQKDLD